MRLYIYTDMPLLYRVILLFAKGKPRPTHTMGSVLGQFYSSQERDVSRSRFIRVARLRAVDGGLMALLPPLHDAVDLCEKPELRRITGYERMEDGPLCLETGFVQTWHLVPAFTDDLILAEHRINLLSEELEALRAGIGPAPGRARL